MYRKNKSDANRVHMCKARSEYKHIIRKKRFESRNDQTSKLLKARVSNAKDYWKLLKGVSFNTTSKTASADAFAKYFKAINNPDSSFYQPDDDIVDFNNKYLNGELDIMFDELDVEITNQELLKSIKQLRNNASGGPDLLLNEFF